MSLNNFLLRRLHENPKISYFFMPGYPASVRVGTMLWSGTASANKREAKDSAAAAALSDLAFLSEPEIRQKCGFPPRFRIREVSTVKSTLRLLRQRANRECINDGHKMRIMKDLQKVYRDLDVMEKSLRWGGLMPL